MTDISQELYVSNLVIDKQQVEIERLREVNDCLVSERIENEAEIERLRAALQPFAAAADTLASFPDATSLDLAPITLGDLRHARRALEHKP